MKEKLFVENSKKNIQIEEFLKMEFSDVRCGEIKIQETPVGTRIIIYTMTPGLVIGSKGEKIKDITEKLKERFKLKNPQLDVQKIKNPILDPCIVAQDIAMALERGLNYKKIGNYYLTRVMNAGARGCEIVMSGKLGGEKARRERFGAGFVEKSGTRESVLKGFYVANPKLGNIGIKVFITLKEAEEQKTEEQPKPDEIIKDEV